MSTDRTFYTKQAVRETETGIEADLLFHAEHDLYNGHFPGNPITPGVCLVQSINDLVEDHYDGVQIKEVRKCKFTAIHNPNVVPNVKAIISVKQTDGELKASCSIEHDGQTYVKYQGTFA